MSDKDRYILCDQCGDHITDDDERVVFALAKGFHLCSRCAEELILNYRDVIDRSRVKAKLKKGGRITPAKIKAFLDEWVISQEEAKRILSLAVYNHYKKLKWKREHKDKDLELDSSHILLIGSTGVGKSHLVKTIAKFLSVPITIETATSLSQVGFVGRDPESVIQSLVEAAPGSTIAEKIKAAEMGIVYIDEFDKLSRKGESPSITRDVSGEGVQQALLKIIEGSTVEIPAEHGQRIGTSTKTVKVNTENILFICGGSFEGIEEIIEKRLQKGKSFLGFGADERQEDRTDILKQVKVEDLKKYGLLPEILGRLPIICPLSDLREEDLVRILTEPKSALIKQYQALLGMDGCKLSVTEEALKEISRRAIKRGTGARSLRSIMEETLGTTMFDQPEKGWKSVIIDYKEGKLITEIGDETVEKA